MGKLLLLTRLIENGLAFRQKTWNINKFTVNILRDVLASAVPFFSFSNRHV